MLVLVTGLADIIKVAITKFRTVTMYIYNCTLYIDSTQTVYTVLKFVFQHCL